MKGCNKMKIEINKRFSGEVIFGGEFDSFKLCLIAAIKNDADLHGANLRDANLRGANLRGANLRGADLCDADLCGADLRGADLCGANLCGANLCDADLWDANLRGADLRGANLCGADLCDADLRNATGNRVILKSINIYQEYPVAYTKYRLQVGCKNFSFKEWKAFSEEEIRLMDCEASNFWARNKEEIFSIIERNPATE